MLREPGGDAIKEGLIADGRNGNLHDVIGRFVLARLAVELTELPATDVDGVAEDPASRCYADSVTLLRPVAVAV